MRPSTPCAYCRRPLESEVPRWAGTAYHGPCRLDALRDLHQAATSDAERERIEAEADAIKSHQIEKTA